MEKKCFPSLLITLYLRVKLQTLFSFRFKGQEEPFYSLWVLMDLFNICIWHVPAAPGFGTIVMYFGHIALWQLDWLLNSNGETQPEVHSHFHMAHLLPLTKHSSKSKHSSKQTNKQNLSSPNSSVSFHMLPIIEIVKYFPFFCFIP